MPPNRNTRHTGRSKVGILENRNGSVALGSGERLAVRATGMWSIRFTVSFGGSIEAPNSHKGEGARNRNKELVHERGYFISDRENIIPIRPLS